jgi:hypothetical protein
MKANINPIKNKTGRNNFLPYFMIRYPRMIPIIAKKNLYLRIKYLIVLVSNTGQAVNVKNGSE